MKKIIIIVFAIFIALLVVAYLFIPRIAVSMITEYEPYTFKRVLSDSVLRHKFLIGNRNKPEDYGYESEEVSFQSLDGTRLNGWYVAAKTPTDQCIILVHGRTSNRLKTIKQLALIDSLQLDSIYNIFIPDMRNSGKSQATKTYMGYKFGEDVVASILLLNSQFKQNTMVLYGFSMGAMAILNATGRDDLTKLYENKNIVIEKIILDSPLVNAKKTIKDGAPYLLPGNIIFNKIFQLYSDQINGYGDSMRLSVLLDTDIPTLILQSMDDHTTRVEFLKEELKDLGKSAKIETIYFHGPDHVRLFQERKSKYIQAVENFLLKHQNL